MAIDDDEPKVKELLAGRPVADIVDAATARELERWFGLPSVEQLEESAKAPLDPELAEVAEVRERREKAIASVDLALVERIRVRTEAEPQRMLKPQTLTLRIRTDIALFDEAMAERGHAIAEPREVELPQELLDDLNECTPQALLRDLHRPEVEYDKQFEVIDYGARIDIGETVASVMSMSLKLDPPGRSPLHEGAELLAELRSYRNQPWEQLFSAQKLPNRRIAE